jgi:hypothetical protein
LVAADEALLSDVCSRLLGGAVVGIERIAGGRNSQVFRLDCAAGPRPGRYVAKQYFTVPEDPRDRLGTEYRALKFLRSRGITTVPAPIAIDPVARCGIYEFLPGEPASLRAASDGDVRQAVDFLARLATIARHSAVDEAAPASEACFSIDAIVENLSVRTARLRALPDDVPGAGELRRFLSGRFEPFLSSLDAWTDEQARAHGVRRDRELPLEERTLSPSDFGLHNAVRDHDGRLGFVDFEYFGWDDPAKMLVDFLHHPAMEMTGAQRRAFAAGVLAAFPGVPGLGTRARMVYPWFGLKWCLILLNEFVPEHLSRRRFAGVADTNSAEVQRRQLDRAERLLDRIDAEYRHNPYLDL